MQRNTITANLFDSGNFFGALISENLAHQLNVKIDKRFQKRVGTARANAQCEILGRTGPLKINIEHIPGSFVIHPFVVRDLSHEMNLGQAFLRQVGAEMTFRNGSISLRVKGGTTELTSSRERIDRPSLDKRFAVILDRYADAGKNPAYYHKNTMRVDSISESSTDTPLVYDNKPKKVYNLIKQVIKAKHTQCVELNCSDNHHSSYQNINVILDPNRYDQKRNEALVWIHPGIYQTNDGTLKVLVSNFNTVDAVIPPGKFVGYIRQITEESPSYDGIHSLPSERQFSKLSDTERATWEQFIISELRLDDNELLGRNSPQRERVINAFMNNLPAVAQHSHDYGDTDLLQFHLQIKPGSRPVRDKCRPLNPIQSKDFERQLKEWTSQGVVEPSISEYASALVPVVKKASSHLRWCVDYRKLNEITIPDQYPLPNISVNLNKLAGSQVYSCLDSCGAYHSIKIEPDSRRYTAFISPFGLFQFVKLPFGLRNAGQCYNRLVQIALGSLGTPEFALAYLDDIIIHSTSLDEHVTHLTKILELHARFGLKLNLSKCQICQTKVDYLGHEISHDGIRMSPKHVEKILDWPLPQSGKQLKSFLGFCGYYRSFISNYGMLTAEMNSVKNTSAPIEWTPTMTEKFDLLKKAFNTRPVRGYPNYSEEAEPFILDTDWSHLCCAAVLSQVQNGREVFLACAAKKCSDAESRYPSYKGEILACVVGIKKFEHMLLCRKFILRTDASALKHLSSLKENRGIFSRWLLYLADFEFDVIHRAGVKHVTADALSRRTDIKDETLYCAQDLLASISTGNTDRFVPLFRAMTTKRIADASSQDPILKQVIGFVTAKHKPTTQERRALPIDVKHYLRFFECLQFKEGVLYFQPPMVNGNQPDKRICIPQSLQKHVFLAGHSADYAGHMGENRTYDILRTRCYFPNMYSFICIHIKNCVTCITKATSSRKPTHRMHKPLIGSFNQCLYVDTVGPLSPACMHQGYKCNDFITIQDGYTRFLAAAPVKDLTAMTLAKAIIENWINVFSVPQRIHSDNGPAFSSALMNEIMKQFQIKRTFTPPYSPEGNRVERAHRVLGQLIRSDRRSPVERWSAKLKIAVYCYNSAVNRATGLSPLHALTGQRPTMPIDFVLPLHKPGTESWSNFIENMKNRYHRIYTQICANHQAMLDFDNNGHRESAKDDIKEGDLVYYFLARVKPGLSKKLNIRWLGPFVVKRQISDSLYVIFPQGKWASNPREIATIVSQLRK